MLFFDAAHHHAEVARFADDADADRVDNLLDGLRYLLRQPLLNLQPPREDIHDPGNLAEPHHLILGQVGHVHLPVERQQVVFAKTEELDVLDHYHLVILHVVEGPVEDLLQIHAIPAGEELHRLVDAGGGPQQTIAVRIFAQLGEYALDLRLNAGKLGLRSYHFHYGFTGFHDSPSQRCFSRSPRFESSPARAIGPGTPS